MIDLIVKRTEKETKCPAFPGFSLIDVKSSAKGGKEIFKIVVYKGVRLGFVTKFKNTKTETHPWKVFHGIGEDATFICSDYGLLNQVISRHFFSQRDSLLKGV